MIACPLLNSFLGLQIVAVVDSSLISRRNDAVPFLLISVCFCTCIVREKSLKKLLKKSRKEFLKVPKKSLKCF